MRYFLFLISIVFFSFSVFADSLVTENDLGYTEIGYFEVDLNNDGKIEIVEIIQPHQFFTNLPDSEWGDDTGSVIRISDSKKKILYIAEINRYQPIDNITTNDRDNDGLQEIAISVGQTEDQEPKTYIYGWDGEYKLEATLDIKRHKADLDNDGRDEFVTYEQRFDIPKDMLPIPIEGEVAVFESSGVKVGSFFMPDHVGEVEFISLNNDGLKQIVARSYGGAHYTNMAIYGYNDGTIYEIFTNGSACPVEADFKANKPIIRVGRADWKKEGWNYASGKPLWQVYVWNGEEFAYDDGLSTTSEISQQEEVEQYVGKIKSLIEENR